MPDCSTCSLFSLETGDSQCLHVNRPGGLAITREAINKLNLPAGSRVADIASGLGTTISCLAYEYQLNPIGLDLSGGMLRNARILNPDLIFAQADSMHMPVSAGSFQAVFMECAFTLSGDPLSSLAEFSRVLVPDGALVISDIYIRDLNSLDAKAALVKTHCLAHAETEPHLRELFQRGGFSIQSWTDHTIHLKRWMANMVFKLGSLKSFYHLLANCDEDACQLNLVLGSQLKLGYYQAILSKMD